ncbi:hypothetical protein GQX73_g6620 [Xylaria multiplex]|uniref:BTB domain-containing protein n=1 Tax=Xylaria multiplex TaxID=323545 RepID=A0A7C8ISG8_9PEZI|nr:hypothetical protein GQX73_g6620 [Xylaria multiplex]
MAVHEVVLDPDGDIFVIVLAKLPEKPAGNPGEAEPQAAAPEPGPPEPEEPAAVEETATEEPAPEDAAIPEAVQNGGQHPDTSTTQGEDQWRFKASSKHLSLASTYVKTMMAGPWREANEVHADGLLHWTFSGFDVSAVSAILSVIHGLNRRVPRAVDLGMLAQISRVVDYLSCHEVMELWVSIWIARLQGPTDSSSRADWDAWISVAGVFQHAEIFKQWTRVAIIQKLNVPPSLELPILSQAYDVIDQRRQLHLGKIFACIYDHMDLLIERKTCSVECDAILLGTLVRQMRAHSFPRLRPTKPYEGMSVSCAVEAMRGLKVPEWYSKVSGSDEPGPNPFEFWGASKKASKTKEKRGKMKVKKQVQVPDGWGGYRAPEEVEELEELVVNEHTCGFDDLIAAVTSVEKEIQGLELEGDLGVRWAE